MILWDADFTIKLLFLLLVPFIAFTLPLLEITHAECGVMFIVT